jgi:superfamily II DNA or RNA helicase
MAILKTLEQAKGYAYEKYVLETLRDDYNDIWLWKDIPESILIDIGIIKDYSVYSECRKDIGIDILAVKDNIYTYIQCKNYENAVCVDDIAGFLFFMITHNVNGMLCYSNKISRNIVNTLEERIDEMSLKITLRHVLFDNAEIRIPVKSHHVPREYQLEAVKAIKNVKHMSCILAMPCGTGKTYTVSMLAGHYNNIIIMSPLKKLTYDVLDNMSIFLGKSYKKMLISSDGIRDHDTIIDSMHDKNIFGCTYDSSDVLINVIENLEENDYLKKTLLIIDEFHNLSANNLTNPEDDLYKILNKEIKKVYLSATPNTGVDHDVIHRYNWEDAIRDEYICDFNITIPTPDVIDDDNLQKMIELLENVGADIDEKMIKKGYFLIRSMLFNGNRKCIVYLTTLEKAKQFNKVIDGLLSLLNVECDVHVITNRTSKKNRERSIYRFRNNDVRTIMLNVHILDEGIDIPECDSIYVTQPNDNIDNLIQRMCRCNRRTVNKTKCNMYMWTTEVKVAKLLKYIKDNTYEGIFNKVKQYSAVSNRVAVNVKNDAKSVKIVKRDDHDMDDTYSNDNKTGKYECSKCLKTFAYKHCLTRHIDNKVCVGKQYEDDGTNDEQFKCKYCGKSFTTSTSMYRHVNHTCKIKKQADNEKSQIYEKLLELEENNKEIVKENKMLKKEVITLRNDVKKITKSSNGTINNNLTDNRQVNINKGTINNTTNQIILVSYGQEDLSKLSKTELIKILQNGYNTTLKLT